MSYSINHVKMNPHYSLNNSKQLRPTSSFKDILGAALDQKELKISKHAQERLNERDIHFSTEEWGQISNKIEQARQKGIHDSLVLVNDAALIVSAKNNTVITAMNLDEAKSQIFTNINGTIIMD